jgi:large subunit ribosomal protein L14e
VALVNYGPELNKLVVIVDLVDQNRVLVEGPGMGVKRQVMNVKRLALTNIKLDELARGAPSSDVRAKYEAADVEKTFASLSWGKKLDRKSKRAALGDFDRFKVMVVKMKRNKKINAELEKLMA